MLDILFCKQKIVDKLESKGYLGAFIWFFKNGRRIFYEFILSAHSN